MCHTVHGAGDVDNLQSLLTAMGIYHEWMSANYIDMPSITTTFASFYIGHLMEGGLNVRGAGIQLNFCKHLLLLSITCGARSDEGASEERKGSIDGVHVNQSKANQIKTSKKDHAVPAQAVIVNLPKVPPNDLHVPSCIARCASICTLSYVQYSDADGRSPMTQEPYRAGWKRKTSH